MNIIINSHLAAVPMGQQPIPSSGNFYHNILHCLGYPTDYPPVADLLRLFHELTGKWLIVSPMYWQATHNDAMIVAEGYDLKLTDEMGKKWFTAFAKFVQDEKMILHYHDATTWLLQCDEHPEIVAKPIHTLRHKSLFPELQHLDNTMFFQRFITEAQMFFSNHPLNKIRTDCPINGIWVWGQGKLSSPCQQPIIAHDKNLLRLAKLLTSEYNTELLNTKSSLLLLNDLNQHDEHILKTQLRKCSIGWYWNNLAYLSKPQRWWSRFMEKINHAH